MKPVLLKPVLRIFAVVSATVVLGGVLASGPATARAGGFVPAPKTDLPAAAALLDGRPTPGASLPHQ